MHFGSAFLNATARAAAGMQPDRRRTRLLLVGHDAFPAGAQHLLLHLGRQLVRAHGVEVRFVLLGGGRLLPEYEATAPTVVASDPAALAAGLRRWLTDPDWRDRLRAAARARRDHLPGWDDTVQRVRKVLDR